MSSCLEYSVAVGQLMVVPTFLPECKLKIGEEFVNFAAMVSKADKKISRGFRDYITPTENKLFENWCVCCGD